MAFCFCGGFPVKKDHNINIVQEYAINSPIKFVSNWSRGLREEDYKGIRMMIKMIETDNDDNTSDHLLGEVS